ncbi:MAG: hypothetical protein JKX79_07340 [Labilibaculum sp.]|nr:hypothetical protein [Labilibaculum sp.]
MQELTMNEIEQVNGGGIYDGANFYIVAWGAVAVAGIITGGGGFLVGGAMLAMFQSYK